MAPRRDTETSFLGEDDISDLRHNAVREGIGRDRRHSIGRITESPSEMYTAPYGGSGQAGTSSVTLDHIDELADLQSVRANLVWWWIGFFASLIAAFLFLIGSFMFLPSMYDHINTGCYMFVAGVLLFWATSCWSAWNYRSRHADATTDADMLAKKVDFAAEIVWVLCYCNYLPGSALFLSYLPPWCVTVGAWMFVIGSVFCCTASFMQMLIFMYLNIKGQEPFLHMALDISSSTSYIIGAVLWLCASVLYLIGVAEDPVYVTAAMTYVVGSVFFVSGAANSLTALTLRLRAVNVRVTQIRNGHIKKSYAEAE